MGGGDLKTGNEAAPISWTGGKGTGERTFWPKTERFF